MNDADIIDPRFLRYVLPNAALLKLADGFGWLEGPVWFADHECLLVSDIPNDRLMRWSEHSGITVFRSPSGYTASRPTACSWGGSKSRVRCPISRSAAATARASSSVHRTRSMRCTPISAAPCPLEPTEGVFP